MCNTLRRKILHTLLITFVFACSLFINSQTFAGTYEAVMKFDGADGLAPNTGLITDGKNFYGTALNSAYLGVVYELSPPSSGSGPWTETVLYSFPSGGDIWDPQAGLARDAQGNLYGTTFSGGLRGTTACSDGCGAVFELSPPSEPGGSWTETTLYEFQGNEDGGGPEGTLILDAAGNLYGTTVNGGDVYGACCGTAFELSPPSSSGGAWTETVLHDFTGGSDGEAPVAGLYRDSTGNLYGTTVTGGFGSSGTVYKLSPPSSGGAWKEKILYSFTGASDGGGPLSVLTEYKGSLYGTAEVGGSSTACSAGCGTVFKLTPNSEGVWSFTAFYSLQGQSDGSQPRSGLAVDSAGNLYGTTAQGGDVSKPCDEKNYDGCGVVFELSPQSGGATWNYAVLHTFDGPDGFLPNALLLSHGVLWGATLQGGAVSLTVCGGLGCGVIFGLGL
jgi:uncharacterized repeat protein (TIGR03803 family)